MDESTQPEPKQPHRGPSPLFWIAVILIVIGSLVASTSLIVLVQPVSEENVWTILAIPFLIAGGCLTFVGVVALIVNGAVRGSAISEEVKDLP
jgi:NAD(P)H-dependent flavin oxidoreductase YrpB (nitropropane dioxygenase family)